jgi:hypothetical protein
MFKQKQVAAKKGYDLLKKKSDALKVNYIINSFIRNTPPVYHGDQLNRSSLETFARLFTIPRSAWEI